MLAPAPPPTDEGQASRAVRTPETTGLAAGTVAVWALFVAPVIVASLAVIAVVWLAWPRVSLIHVGLVVFVYGLAARVRGGVRVGRAGLTQADIRRWHLAQASGTAGVSDPTDRLDDFAVMVEAGPVLQAEQALPQLFDLVLETAARIGAPAPAEVILARGGWTVVVSDDGTRLSVGTPFLLVATLDELRAELVRHLAPHASHDALVALRRARGAITAAGWHVPGITSRLDVVWTPATAVARLLEPRGARAAQALRAASGEAAVRLVGEAPARDAQARAWTLPEVWRSHVRDRQLAWTTSGAPVTPHGDWRAAWEDAARPGSVVPVRAADVLDPLALAGWEREAPSHEAPPALAAHSALDALAGERYEAVLRSFDDESAAQYYGELVNRTFGAAGGEAAQEDGVGQAFGDRDPAAATESEHDTPRNAPVAVDPRAERPQLDLVARQLEALELGAMRRDPEALRTARAIARVAAAPTVVTMAAGVCWVAGDPQGPDRIRRALAAAPRGAGALIDLVDPLRSVGEHDVADEIERAVAVLGGAVDARYNLRKMWGRAARLEQPDLPDPVREALKEIADLYAPRTRIWIAEIAVGPAGLRPAAFVVVGSFWSLSLGHTAKVERQYDVEHLLNMVWPVTRVLSADQIEARGRRRLRKAFERLN